MRHVLKDVKLDQSNGSWSALCTCGQWASVGAPTARKIRSEHKEHKKFWKERSKR